jgi:hypothetical protein
MNVNDYLIDHSDFAWSDLLDDWRWLLAAPPTVWLCNRFAELVLVMQDGTVSYLETSAGALKKIAASRQDFIVKLDQGDNANEWLMIPLVDRCRAAGKMLGPNQCYGFTTPPVLGGAYALPNIEATDLTVYLAVMGQIHRQIKDVPDGTKIRMVVGP